MSKLIGIIVSIVVILLVLSGIVYSEIEPELANVLQKTFDENAKKYNISGATLAIKIQDQGTWKWACGMANLKTGTAMNPDNMLYIASITKTFVAATILKLKEDNVLTLDDSVEQWLPSLVPNGENITIRYLLRHTSGLFDYISVLLTDAVKDPNKVWQPEELIAIAVAKPPVFAPGERYSYCNTGYVLLGMIIEAATGKPVEQEIRQRLLDPLQLNHTFLDGREIIPDGLAQSPKAPVPYTSLATGAWTAGAMVSNVEDLTRWAEALYSGDVLKRESLDEMLTFTAPSLGYGLGVMKQPTLMGEAYGHDGGITGYSSKMYYIPDAHIAIAALDYGSYASFLYGLALKVISNPKSVNVLGKLATTWGSIKEQ